MKEKIDIQILERYLKGQYSFVDLKRVAEWFENFKYHNEIKSVIEQHWTNFDLFETNGKKDLSKAFFELKTKILDEKHKNNFREQFIRIYFRVAAILLLPLLVYSSGILDRFWDSSTEGPLIEIVSPKGTRTHFDLPDGTKVSLNSGTHLKYNKDFDKNRQVELEGEAYFDVAHQTANPFVVKTDVLSVKVLGTKFNVAAFGEEKRIEVVLERGKVELTGRKKSFSQVLGPNEGFYYNKETHSGLIKQVDAPYLVAWKNGFLIFRSDPLGEVLKRIGRWYNVRFDIQDKVLENFSYRATFHDEPLEEVLRLIALTAPIEYEIKERTMNDDQTYTNKVIVIRLKQ